MDDRERPMLPHLKCRSFGYTCQILYFNTPPTTASNTSFLCMSLAVSWKSEVCLPLPPEQWMLPCPAFNAFYLVPNGVLLYHCNYLKKTFENHLEFLLWNYIISSPSLQTHLHTPFHKKSNTNHDLVFDQLLLFPPQPRSIIYSICMTLLAWYTFTGVFFLRKTASLALKIP